ncbi:aminotransferase class III-fold pyridoxal phosphate-dependent enzyme [Patescibacteria group bacterium]
MKEAPKKTKKGEVLWKKTKKIIPGGTQLLSKRPELILPEQWPCYFKKAKGIEVWDLDGNKFLDMFSMGLGSCILGYADPDVNRAVNKAVNRGSMSTLNSPEEVELAELLCTLHPWAKMARFARTGGEAMAIAVRIGRAFTKKDKIAFCGYHGWNDWYISANLANKKNLDGHLLPGLEPKGVPRGLKGTAIPFHYNKIEELEKIVAENKNIGLIIMEPIRYQKPKNGFLEKVRKIADKSSAVLIFDEVTSGWRFNVGGIHLKYGVNPDIVVFGKGMSNGFPMAAIIGKKDIMEAAQETFISSTYWTEKIGPVAALATIKKMKEKRVPAYLEKIGKIITKGLKKSAMDKGLKLKIIGLPALINFSFDYGKDSQAIRTLFTQEMLKKGILASTDIYVSYSFKQGHVVKYLESADEVFALLKNAIKKNIVHDLLKGPVAHTGFQRLT